MSIALLLDNVMADTVGEWFKWYGPETTIQVSGLEDTGASEPTTVTIERVPGHEDDEFGDDETLASPIDGGVFTEDLAKSLRLIGRCRIRARVDNYVAASPPAGISVFMG